MLPKLNVRLLGQPQITLDTRPVKINRRQTRALLFFLAGCNGMVGRSELIDKFFSAEGIEDDVAHRRLRELISKLRSDLPDPDSLVTANGQVGLDPERVEVDVIAFERLYQAAEPHLKKHAYGQVLPGRILPTLEAAVGLWYGKEFMQGLILDGELQHWQTEKNAHLWELRENLLKHLGGHAVALNDLESAVTWLRTALEPNQYSNVEDVYHLLVILKSLGRLNEALKLVALLKKRYEMDGETMPDELEKICGDITNQFSPEYGSDWDIWGQTFTLQTRLVGRQKELKKLQAAYREKQAVIIWGDTGMGKSRLVHEFYRSLPSPPQLMVATCRQMEQNQPFEPLMDMLEQCLVPADWDLVDKNTLEHLVSYIPDTIHRLNKTIRFDTGQPLPEMVYEAIYRVLCLKAASNRVLVFIKNLQWCDESSLNVLAYLLKKGFFKEQGFLILSGLASEKKAAFDAFIGAINRQANPYEIIFLDTLKEDDVRQLVEDILGMTPSAEMVHKITAESGGSPFILSEYLRWHLQKNPGKSPDEMMKDAAIPSNVTSLMRARLKELDPQLRHVLNGAAVVGEQFTLDSISVVLDLNHIKEEVVVALERLEDMHLIKPVVKYDPIGGYTFTYPRMCQLVLKEIKTARKQLMYQRMATYLEGRSGQRLARPSVLAQYFQKGGDEVKAFYYWVQAAENAFHKYSLAESGAALKAGEAILLRQKDLFSDEQLSQFLSLYVDFCRSQTDDITLARIARLTLDFGQRRDSHLLVGLGLRYRALFEVKDGRLAAALQTIEESRRHLKTTLVVHELLRAYNVSGILYHQANRLDDCRQIFNEVLRLGEQSRLEHPADVRIERELALAEDGLASMEIRQGLPQIALVRLERAIDGMEMCFDYRGLAHAQTTQAEALIQMGSYPQAREAAGRAVRTTAALRGDVLSASAQLVFAQVNYLLGNMDESWLAFEKASDICETLHLVEEKARFHLIRGMVYFLLEDFEKAVDEYKAGLVIKSADYTTTETLLYYGLSLRNANRYEEGSLHLKEAQERINRQGFVALQLAIDTIRAVEIGNMGDFDRACQLLEILAEKSNQRGLKQTASTTYFYYGSFMLAKGNLSVARRLVMSLVGPDNIHDPWTVMRGLILLEQINRHDGLKDETTHRRMLELMENLGSKTTLEPLKKQLGIFSKNVQRQFLD